MTDESQVETASGAVTVDDSAYLEQVRREIDEEVRKRRASGDFPPSFERKLDELFARFTPTGTHDDHFTDALKLADRAAYFDTAVPFGSRRKPQGFTKWMLWQAEAWFVNYVVRQLNHFSSSLMRVAHLLDERVSEVEREVEMLVEPALPEEDAIAPGADPLPYVDQLRSRLRATGSPVGRILHAECGDGSLLEALSDLDSYGIDPGTAASDVAVTKGLDVRRDDVLGHLSSVGDEKLSGLVLSGCVDRMSLSERRRLLRLAEIKIAPGGTVAFIVSTPDAWEKSVGPVVADLSSGSPWHAETWSYLASRIGFENAETIVGPGSSGSPESHCVIATKRRPATSIPAGGQ